jgi:hypothetical protein
MALRRPQFEWAETGSCIAISTRDTGPESREWHTVRFRLDDPQFVNYWGYNFALESDGNTYNRYFLRSVEVRKGGQAD